MLGILLELQLIQAGKESLKHMTRPCFRDRRDPSSRLPDLYENDSYEMIASFHNIDKNHPSLGT